MVNIPDKKKKNIQQYKSDLHAIAPLPLDVIHERLYRLEDKQVVVQAAAIGSDGVAFAIQHHQSRRINAEVYGNLRRWQGTQTRVDAASRTFVPGEWVNYGLYMLTLVLLMAASAFVLAILLTIAWIGGTVVSKEMWIFAAIVLAVYTRTKLPWVDLYHKQHQQATKDIDMMMQGLADALTEPNAAPLLEFDGTDDSLARLLNQQGASRIRLGSDGELR